MIPHTKAVVIGSSLGPESDLLVASGLGLARALGAAAEVVHAYAPITPVFSTFEGAVVMPQITDDERRGLLETLEAQIARLNPPPADGASPASPALKVSAWLGEGSAHRLLVERAAALDSDLIIVGSVESGKHNWTFGSTADRVVRQAPCPVLVLRSGSRLLPHRVLVPVDLSPTSRWAIESGLALFAPLEETPTFELLFALDPFDSAGLRQFRQDQLIRLAEAELQRIATVFESRRGALVQRKVRVGSAATEILAEIEERQPDLVVVGTHGYGGLERLLLGSVAARVVRSAPVSVLVVPPRAGRRAEEERYDAAQRGPEGSYVSDEIHPPAA